MRIESEGDARAVSSKGAIGLMQIMPRTYAGLRARHHLGPDPFNPHDNILAGSAYLRETYDRYDSPGFLAAYNAGLQRYEDHLTGRRPLPDETRTYLRELSSAIGLFAPRGNVMSISGRSSTEEHMPRARVVDLSALVPQSTGLFARGNGGGRQ
jgi:soluble lytic murein transglycosylase-like protein